MWEGGVQFSTDPRVLIAARATGAGHDDHHDETPDLQHAGEAAAHDDDHDEPTSDEAADNDHDPALCPTQR